MAGNSQFKIKKWLTTQTKNSIPPIYNLILQFFFSAALHHRKNVLLVFPRSEWKLKNFIQLKQTYNFKLFFFFFKIIIIMLLRKQSCWLDFILFFLYYLLDRTFSSVLFEIQNKQTGEKFFGIFLLNCKFNLFFIYFLNVHCEYPF